MTDHRPDVTAQINAVERSIALTDQGGDAIHAVQTLRQEYPTNAADLWDAVTTKERLARWFAPVSGDLRVGGVYQIEGNSSGTIEACEAPSFFRATWEFGGAITRILVTVEHVGDNRAALVIEHAGEVPRGVWDQFGPAGTGVGWDLGMLGLFVYVSVGSERPIETDEWASTDDARVFITDVSHRWADVAVAEGVEPDAAHAAAVRIAAFFTESSA